MKKILIIHHSSVIGGAGISLLNVIEVLKNSYDITVYVSGLHDDFYNILKKQNINVFKYKGRIAALYYHASSYGIFNLAFWYRLLLIPLQFTFWKKIVKRHNPDLVVVNSLVLSWFSLITKNKNIKSLCFVRETFSDFKLSLITKWQRKLLSKFDGVSFITGYDQQFANLPEKVKSFVNYDFLDNYNEVNDNRTQNKSTFKVLYIGGISRIKGIKMVVEAANILKPYPYIEFDLVGEDFRERNNVKKNLKNLFNSNYLFVSKVKRNIKELKLDEKLTFHGIQSDMQPFYHNCDIVILPITKPHQQRGVFEAGWFNKPVIVPKFQQLFWAVKHDYNGVFFEINNANDLAKQILELFNNREKCYFLGHNNFKLTKSNHTKEICNEKIIQTFKKVLND